MTTELKFRMMMTDTNVDYIASHFAKVSGMVVYHNVLRDMTTACGMQLIGIQPKDLKPTGEPRCKRCVRAIDALENGKGGHHEILSNSGED